jgi:hypothetical protein
VPATVTYRVTNSKGESTSQQVSITASGNYAVIERTLYTLSRTALQAIQVGGMYRGDNHDRQHLGVFMPVGSTLSVRKMTPNVDAEWDIICFQGRARQNLRLNLSANQWQTLTGTDGKGGLPLIRTPRMEDLNGQPAVIEVKISGGVTDLDYFHYGDDTKKFLNKWENSGNHFALLGNRVVNIMTSRTDVNNGWFTTREFAYDINGLLTMYAEVVDLFDKMIGLDINAPDPIDRLVRTRFLVVPYRGGAGYAFYGRDFCGFSVGDEFGEVRTYLGRNWVVFHEIGHGYEGTLRQKETPMVEIKNNILSTHFQLTFKDFTQYADRRASWLFEGARNPAEVVDARSVERRNRGLAGFRGGDHFRDKQYIMLLPTNAAGTIDDSKRAIRELNLLHRRNLDWSLADLYTIALHNSANINVIPFMQSFGFTVSDWAKAKVFESGSRIAQPFRDLTSNSIEHLLFPANGRLLWGTLSLVTPGEFDLGYGTATITLDIDNFRLIRGQTIQIRDGDNVVQTIRIDRPTVNVAALPAGAYIIDLPPARSGHFVTGYNYLIIKADTNSEMTVSYTPMTVSPIVGATHIALLGGGDSPVADVRFDAQNSQLLITTTGNTAHWVRRGRGADINPYALYCRVAIYRNNIQLISKEYTWTGENQAGVLAVNTRIGDEIRIYHVEGSTRARGVSSITGEQNELFYFPTSEVATVVVTRYGLVMQGTDVATQREIFTNNFNALLQQFIEVVPENKIDGMQAYNDLKVTLILGSELLSAADRAVFNSSWGNRFRRR